MFDREMELRVDGDAQVLAWTVRGCVGLWAFDWKASRPKSTYRRLELLLGHRDFATRAWVDPPV